MTDFSVSPLFLCSSTRVSKYLCVSPTYTLPHWASFSLGRGSFTMVSSERRVGPDLTTTLKLYFSQNRHRAFLIHSLTPLTYAITASGCFSSSLWDSSSSGSGFVRLLLWWCGWFLQGGGDGSNEW